MLYKKSAVSKRGISRYSGISGLQRISLARLSFFYVNIPTKSNLPSLQIRHCWQDRNLDAIDLIVPLRTPPPSLRFDATRVHDNGSHANTFPPPLSLFLGTPFSIIDQPTTPRTDADDSWLTKRAVDQVNVGGSSAADSAAPQRPNGPPS